MQTIEHDVQISAYTIHQGAERNVRFRRFQSRVPAPGHSVYLSVSASAGIPDPGVSSGYAWTALLLESQGTFEPRPWLLLSWIVDDPDGTSQDHHALTLSEPGEWTLQSLLPVSVSSARQPEQPIRLSYYLSIKWMEQLEHLVGPPSSLGAWLFNRLLPRWCQGATRIITPRHLQTWVAL